MREIPLPAIISDLVTARQKLRDRYVGTDLRFTFDGNLVGDIGEALAAERFGLTLERRCGQGIDGHAPDGRTVQVKATGTNRGPVFRMVETCADHLLFFAIDFDRCLAEIVYNGPECRVTQCLPEAWSGQRMVTLSRVRRCDAEVADHERLARV
jgi:hypothetical protein